MQLKPITIINEPIGQNGSTFRQNIGNYRISNTGTPPNTNTYATTPLLGFVFQSLTQPTIRES